MCFRPAQSSTEPTATAARTVARLTHRALRSLLYICGCFFLYSYAIHIHSLCCVYFTTRSRGSWRRHAHAPRHCHTATVFLPGARLGVVVVVALWLTSAAGGLRVVRGYVYILFIIIWLCGFGLFAYIAAFAVYCVLFVAAWRVRTRRKYKL